MSTKSPRLLAATVTAALALVAGACSSGGAISDLVSDQLPETSEVEETTDEAESTEEEVVVEDEAAEDTATEEEAEEDVEPQADEDAQVLGETEDIDEDDAAEDAADEDEDATDEEAADEGESLGSLIDDAGLSEEDSLTLGTDLGEAEDTEEDAEAEDAEEEAVATRFAISGVDVGLNLRTGPGASFDVLTGVERDRVLTGTGNVDGGWTEVQIDGLTGWVLGEFLVATEAVDAAAVVATPAPAPATFTVVDVDAGVNLRSGPGIDNPVVGGALLGETVTATGNVSGAWTEVTHDGVTGWASTDRLSAN